MGLKVSQELDTKYAKACELCAQKHRAIFGVSAEGCAFKNIDGEYCDDISNAEGQARRMAEKSTVSELMAQYLKFLRDGYGNSHAYDFIGIKGVKFSKRELISIIRAFDQAIAGLRYCDVSPDIISGTYSCVCNSVYGQAREIYGGTNNV